MPDIFVSYSHEDRPHAERIAKAFMADGFDVFWDQDLVPGDVWSERIETALQAAPVVIVLWSHLSVGSKWVRAEANAALNRGKRVVPVRLEPVPVPLPFGELQALDLYDVRSQQEWTRGYDRLKIAVGSPSKNGENKVLIKRGFIDHQRASRFDWRYVFFAMEGRISRKQYWLSVLIALPINAAAYVVIGAIARWSMPNSINMADAIAVLAYTVIFLYPNIATSLKRLHDFNWSGWWTAPILVLYTVGLSATKAVEGDMSKGGIVVLLLGFVLCLPNTLIGIPKGDAGENRNGPPP